MTADSLLDEMDESYEARKRAVVRMHEADVFEAALKEIIRHVAHDRFYFAMTCSEIAEKALKQVKEEACGNLGATSTVLTSPTAE